MAPKKNSSKDAFKKSAVKINSAQTARKTKAGKQPVKKAETKTPASKTTGGYGSVWGGGCSTMRINQRRRGGW